AGLSLSLMRKWIGHALAEYGSLIPSYLPPPTMKRQGLISLTRALAQLHQPGAQADPSALNDGSSVARRSILFDELFYLQLGLGLRKKARSETEGGIFTRQSEVLAAAMEG